MRLAASLFCLFMKHLKQEPANYFSSVLLFLYLFHKNVNGVKGMMKTRVDTVFLSVEICCIPLEFVPRNQGAVQFHILVY